MKTLLTNYWLELKQLPKNPSVYFMVLVALCNPAPIERKIIGIALIVALLPFVFMFFVRQVKQDTENQKFSSSKEVSNDR